MSIKEKLHNCYEKFRAWLSDARVLQKALFVLIAALVGIIAYVAIIGVEDRVSNRPEEYKIKSPSEITGQPITLDDSEAGILAEQCSTFSGPVAISFDTNWVYYPSVSELERGDSVPGVNGFSGDGIRVDPGGSGCADSFEEIIEGRVLLGDPALWEQNGEMTAGAGGMFPGFWSMESQITVYECNEFRAPEGEETVERCVDLGTEVGSESWFSETFEIVEAS